jgi:hypothetical protein
LSEDVIVGENMREDVGRGGYPWPRRNSDFPEDIVDLRWVFKGVDLDER